MSTGTTFGRKQGWGQAGSLITGDTAGTVTMQAQFEDPGTYTVQFSKTDNPGSNVPIFATAIITWSVEGHFLSRKVNVANGVSVSGVGQAVRVIMKDATPDSGVTTPNGVSYNVSVQVSKGVRGANKQPPILLPGKPSAVGAGSSGDGGLYDTPAGGDVTIPVPADAGIISIYVTVYAATPIAEGDLKITLAYDGFAFKVWDPRDFPDWVPIVPGTNNLLLQNLSGVTVLWSVAFGIDG